MRRSRGDIYQCDAVDRGLLDLLAADPRKSNRELAERGEVTQETVGIRFKRMLDEGAMAMTALNDWTAAGYGARASVRVKVRDGARSNMLTPLLENDAVHLVA